MACRVAFPFGGSLAGLLDAMVHGFVMSQPGRIPPNATLVFEVELLDSRVLSRAERDSIDAEVASLRP